MPPRFKIFPDKMSPNQLSGNSPAASLSSDNEEESLQMDTMTKERARRTVSVSSSSVTVPKKTEKSIPSKLSTLKKLGKRANKGKKYIVERLCDKRFHDGRTEYFVKWEDYSTYHNTWEPIESFRQCPSLIQLYEKELASSRRNRLQDSADVRVRDKLNVTERGVPAPDRDIIKTKEGEPDSVEPTTTASSFSGPGPGFDQRRVANAIRGITVNPMNKERFYVIEWKDAGGSSTPNVLERLPESIIREKFPQLLIDFLTSKIMWTVDLDDCSVSVNHRLQAKSEFKISEPPAVGVTKPAFSSTSPAFTLD